MNRKYQTPIVEIYSFHISILAGSDNVGLVTDGGSNAAKYNSANLWDDEDE